MHTRINRLTALTTLALWAAAIVSPADTVQLNPSKDNTIYEEGLLSNGAGIHLFAGKTGDNEGLEPSFRRALLQFDLSSAIPAGSTVESVMLTLHVSNAPPNDSSNSRLFGLHRMTSDWGEGSSDAANAEGRGDTPTAGDATWDHSFYPDQEWPGFQGGDFAFSASATTGISGTGYYDWESPELVQDVQDWVDNPQANFGWIVIGPNVDRTARRFDSRENPESGLWPLLTVTYRSMPSTWGGFTIEENGRTVDTGDFLGVVDIASRPWIYVYSLGTWIYLPEDQISEQGGWLYLPR